MTNKPVCNKQHNTFTQQPEMLKQATQLSQYTFCVAITMFCAMSCFLYKCYRLTGAACNVRIELGLSKLKLV